MPPAVNTAHTGMLEWREALSAVSMPSAIPKTLLNGDSFTTALDATPSIILFAVPSAKLDLFLPFG